MAQTSITPLVMEELVIKDIFVGGTYATFRKNFGGDGFSIKVDADFSPTGNPMFVYFTKDDGIAIMKWLSRVTT